MVRIVLFKREVIHIYMGKYVSSLLLLKITHFLHSIYGVLLVIVLMGFRPRKRVNG